MKKIDLQQAISIAYKCYQSKQYKKVKHILQQFIQNGVQSIDIYYFMAASHYCLDEYEQVVEAYRRAIQINPDFAILHFGLGNIYVRLRLYDAAVNSYNQALTICGRILDRECNSDGLGIALESNYDRSAPRPTYLLYIDMSNYILMGIWKIK